MNIFTKVSSIAVATWCAVAAVAQEGWRLVPGTGPAARQLAAVAYDSVRKVAVLFGGAGDGGVPLGDTWEFDGRQWQQVSTLHAPPARLGHGLAYDPGRGMVVLFGGSGNLQDTWEYDGVDWHQRTSPTSPSDRYGTAMAYDRRRGRTVLFGGLRSNGQVDSELWEWDGVTWSLFSANAIPGRRHHAMCWSDRLNGVLIVGGLDNSQLRLGDTGVYFAEGGWNYFANITARTGSSVCENPLTNLLVLTGGSLLAPGPTIVADNLMYGASGNSYSPRSAMPEALSYHVSFFDERRHQVVVFGGLGPSGLSDRTYAYCADHAPLHWMEQTIAGLSAGDAGDQAVGRFDADAARDVAVLLPAEDRVDVFLNPSATVLPANLNLAHVVNLPAGAFATSVAFGELGLGAGEELVVACPGRNQVDILVGPGTPSVQSLPVGGLQLPVHALVGDLDGSAVAEIVVACRGTLLSRGGVAVIHDLGMSVQTITHPVLSRFERIAVVDLDGDGDRDVAALGHGASDGIWLLANNGGTLLDVGVVPLPGSGAATDIAAADFDGDGDADLLVSSASLFPTFDNRLVVVRNDAAAPLAPASFVGSSFVLPTGFTTRISVGDVDGFDGGTGVDVALLDALGGTTYSIGWVTEAGLGTSRPQVTSSVGRAVLGDVNGDGCDDLVVGLAGGSLRVRWSLPASRSEVYGAGCEGSYGLRPAAFSRRGAYYDTRLQLRQALGQSAAVLLLDLAPGFHPLGGGCTLLLDNPILLGYQVTDAVGRCESVLSFPVSVIGYDLFAQWAVLDPNGSFGGFLALSNGVQVQLGF